MRVYQLLLYCCVSSVSVNSTCITWIFFLKFKIWVNLICFGLIFKNTIITTEKC